MQLRDITSLPKLPIIGEGSGRGRGKGRTFYKANKFILAPSFLNYFLKIIQK